jgi:hypothetical protein
MWIGETEWLRANQSAVGHGNGNNS